jgi:hypothetical protein
VVGAGLKGTCESIIESVNVGLITDTGEVWQSRFIAADNVW